MATNRFLTCPDDCNDDLQLGALDIDQDCTNYDLTDSQVCDLLIVPDSAEGDPITWADADPWEAEVDLELIDNSSIDGTKSKLFSGIGGIDEPEEEIAEYPKKKTKVVNKIYTLIYEVKNLSQNQYNTLRQFQCGWTSFKFRYADLGGFLYGGETGIIPKSTNCTFPKGAGNTDKNFARITITWEADGDPDRNYSPF